MTYRDPYADQYGDSSNSYYNGKDRRGDHEIFGSENMPKNVYQLQQVNTWSQDTDPYGQDQETTYHSKSSTSSHRPDMTSYGYQSNYKYPPVQRTLTEKSSSKKTRPAVEVAPVPDQFRQLGDGKDGFEKGEFTPNTPKKLAVSKFTQQSY